MPYVDREYYVGTFKGEPVDDADFSSLCMRAEELIEEMTMYRITPTTVLAMPEAVQERVKMAVCAQIEYLDANGGSDMDNGADLQSAGLGRFNYTKSSGANGSTEQSMYAPRAIRLLAPTGLLYRGGGAI
nr:MAG TPA: Head Tail Connector Protein [Caudoviricetes sp.]